MSEEDEEHEGDATERLRSELGEKYETDMNNLQVIQVMAFPSSSLKRQPLGNAKRAVRLSVLFL